MITNWLETLETPCIVLDKNIIANNLKKMQSIANNAGCNLRPHIKTHKMPYMAQLQIELGAKGISCATLSEAEVMADGGIDDIFIAYPLIGSLRIKRAILLQARINRLILAVDSLEGAKALSYAAQKAGTAFEIRLEVDTGANRTGVHRENLLSLTKDILALEGLSLTGIYTFKSMLYQNNFTLNRQQAGQEEGEQLEEIAKVLKENGANIIDISGGSTPTGEAVATSGKVTEIRPGTYIYNDYMQVMNGNATLEDIAGTLYVTVVSTPSKDLAVIDGGTKTFPMDIALDSPPFHYPGYAIIQGKEHLQLRRMNEEHGIINSTTGETGLTVGDILALTPIHICTAINMQNKVYIKDNNKLLHLMVDARGMLF